MTMRPGLTKSVILAAIIAMGLFLRMVSVTNAYTVPQPGVYTFANAQSQIDGTMITADGFFIIDRYDGSGANSIVGADALGAYIFFVHCGGNILYILFGGKG